MTLLIPKWFAAECLGIYINLSEKNLATTDFGEYTLSLPLEIQSDDNLGQVYLMPNKLDIRFILNEIITATPLPTETKSPTATYTPAPTNTPTPTNTLAPTPTITPEMGTTNVRCQGKSEIDLGELEINEDGSVSARQDCMVEVNSSFPTQPMLVSIESEQVEILPFLSLVAGNSTGKSVQVSSETKQISVILNLSPEEVEKLKGGTHRFKADLVFSVADSALVGDFKNGETNLPLSFEIIKPKSKLPLLITVGMVVLIAFITLLKNMAKKSKPPMFKLIMEKRDESGFESISLMRNNPTRIEKNNYKIR